MLIEAPAGNLFDAAQAPWSDAQVDWLDITWFECSRRAQRKYTRAGELVRLLLRVGVSLRHGDILCRPDAEARSTIAINVLPCEVLVARPSDPSLLGALCYELGNLHVPVQLDQDHIVTIDDGPVAALFERLRTPFKSDTRRFEPTLLPTTEVTISSDFALNRRAGSEHPTS